MYGALLLAMLIHLLTDVLAGSGDVCTGVDQGPDTVEASLHQSTAIYGLLLLRGSTADAPA